MWDPSRMHTVGCKRQRRMHVLTDYLKEAREQRRLWYPCGVRGGFEWNSVSGEGGWPTCAGGRRVGAGPHEKGRRRHGCLGTVESVVRLRPEVLRGRVPWTKLSRAQGFERTCSTVWIRWRSDGR